MCNFPILVWDVLTPSCDFMSIVRFVNARTQEFLPLDEVSKNILRLTPCKFNLVSAKNGKVILLKSC